MKRVLSFVLMLIFCVSAVSCAKKADEQGDTPYKLIISCHEIIQNLDSEKYAINEEKKEIVPEDGIVLEINSKCSKGDTAYSVTVNALKNNKIHFEGSDGYLKAIANIYAGDCGDFSGWMFFINGNLAELGANDTIINENDVIEFKYIVDYNTLFQ